MLLVGLRNVYSGPKEEPGSGSDWVRADAHFLETEEMCVQLLSLGFHIEQLVRENSPEPHGNASCSGSLWVKIFKLFPSKKLHRRQFYVTLGMFFSKGRAQSFLPVDM